MYFLLCWLLLRWGFGEGRTQALNGIVGGLLLFIINFFQPWSDKLLELIGSSPNKISVVVRPPPPKSTEIGSDPLIKVEKPPTKEFQGVLGYTF